MALQAAHCGGGEGRCSQHELCTGQFSLLPAGPGSTSYAAPCIRTERSSQFKTGFDRETVTITLKEGILSHIVSAGSLQVVVLVPLFLTKKLADALNFQKDRKQPV